MPRPVSISTITRPDLGVLAWEYAANSSEQGYIGMDIMPVFPVIEQSADYPVIPVESLLKVEPTSRAPRANYNRGDWQFKMQSYSCSEYGWEEPLDDVEARLYQRYFDAEVVTIIRAENIVLRGQEKRIASLVMNESNAVGTRSVAVAWSDHVNCDPLKDVTLAKQDMLWASGLRPNVMVLSETLFDNLILSEKIQNYMKYVNSHLTDGREVKAAILASYFGVSQLKIADAIVDIAGKGRSKDLKSVWGDNYVSLLKVSSGGQDLREPCFGRCFLWTADSPSNVMAESYREEQTRSNIYRVRQHLDEAIIFKGANFLLKDVI